MTSFVYQRLAIRTLLSLCLGIGAACVTSAQNPSSPVKAANDQQPRTESNESFELNIPDRHITQTNYEAGTAVELIPQDRNDLRLHVGVNLHADKIDVHLRNVTGTVRFHGSLQRILELLNLRLKANPSQ
jgi:hypothetical protein